MQSIEIPIAEGVLKGNLVIPSNPKALILFVHGSGSSRHSPRNNLVADLFHKKQLSTLLFDLLTEQEEMDEIRGEYRFNIELLKGRLDLATKWVKKKYPELQIGYFGASTGAAAALKASIQNEIFAIVSRGGRPDLASDILGIVKAPTLLIVGSLDLDVIYLNQEAQKKMGCEVELLLLEGATHLFEEHGKLQQVADFASQWFLDHIVPKNRLPKSPRPG
jgi:putative phosphoribosyl transferase